MDKETQILDFYLKTKWGWGVVAGRSMEPNLKEGWKIKVEPADEGKIKIGDIAVFGKESFTCHRIVGKVRFFGQTYFIHKGDNASLGGVFKARDLVGKVNHAQWQKSYFKNIKILSLGYLYLFMYLLKRYIWQAHTNKLIKLVNRLCWKCLLLTAKTPKFLR